MVEKEKRSLREKNKAYVEGMSSTLMDYYTAKDIHSGRSQADYTKEALSKIHEYSPSIVFLTETSSIQAGYLIKEALRRAYPNEPLPKFYRIDPRQVIEVMEEGKKIVEGKEKAGESFNERRRELKEFFNKRIKDKNARILIYDQDWVSGKSPGSILALLKNPERYALDKSLKSPNVKVGPAGDGFPPYKFSPNVAHELDIHDEDILQSAPINGYMFWRITSKRPPLGRRHNFRATIGYSEGSRPSGVINTIMAFKNVGKKLGEELHTELEQEAQKQKSLEQRVSSVVAIAGLVSSFFFLGSGVTGNAIGNISQSSGSWLGIGLLLLGIAGALVYFRSKKR